MNSDSEHDNVSKYTQEQILIENPLRFVLFPIQYKKTWSLYKQAVASTWFAEEIDFSDDIIHYKKISDDEKYFINNILAFFASSDGIVNENLIKNLMVQVQIPEIRAFYTHQMFIESIHSEAYSLMIDVFVHPDQKKHLFEAILTIPIIKKMGDWALKWMNSDKPFTQKMIAFACIEGILFSGPFCSIYWLKKRGLMPGLCYANELISRDEGLHCQFATHIYIDLIKNKESYSIILEIFKEVVELEIEFINVCLPCSLIGMNSDMMTEYIKYVADRLLIQLGYTSYWNAKNPFDWMELISVDTKTNFFEKRVSEYGLATAKKNNSVINQNKYIDININDDF